MLLRARGREIIAHTSIGRDKLDCPLSLRVLHVRECCVALVVSRGKKTTPPQSLSHSLSSKSTSGSKNS